MRCTSTHRGLQCDREAHTDGRHEAANTDACAWSWWTDAATSSPGMSPGQTAEGIESEGTPNAEDADTNAAGDDDTVAPASRGTATRRSYPRCVIHDGLLGILPFDPFEELRRMGEESRAEPLTDDEAAMLERVKAAVHASTAHDWTFDPYHQAHRCKACGLVSYDAELPAGPCTCAPSRWVPPGASEPGPALEDDDVTTGGIDIIATLERMGEEYRASLLEPLTAEEEAALQRLRVNLGLVKDDEVQP